MTAYTIKLVPENGDAVISGSPREVIDACWDAIIRDSEAPFVDIMQIHIDGKQSPALTDYINAQVHEIGVEIRDAIFNLFLRPLKLPEIGTGCPYTFAATCEADAVAYICNRKSGHHGAFQWNVKAGAARFDMTAEEILAKEPGRNVSAKRDKAWSAHATSEHVWSQCVEDAARIISDDEWSSYPGEDQGAWKFHFAGRCGGWLVLTEWCGFSKMPRHVSDIPDFLAGMSPEEIDAFYVGIVCADHDFTPEKAADAVTYAAIDAREQWEEEQDRREEAERVERRNRGARDSALMLCRELAGGPEAQEGSFQHRMIERARAVVNYADGVDAEGSDNG